MTDELRLRRLIDAPPDVVFKAFTTGGGQEALYGQDDPGPIVESQCDQRVGSLWTRRAVPCSARSGRTA